MAMAAVGVLVVVAAGCGDDAIEATTFTEPVERAAPHDDPSTEPTPDTAPPEAAAAERIPDDVAVVVANERYDAVFGMCADVLEGLTTEPVDYCLDPVADAAYGPDAYSVVVGYNPTGAIVTFLQTPDGWVIDQEIDTATVVAECDVEAPPPDAVEIVTDHGIDIDFNRGEDRLVQWATGDTTYIQAHGESTLKSERYEVPSGYRVVGSRDIDGQATDEYLVLANDQGETIELWVEECGWETSSE